MAQEADPDEVNDTIFVTSTSGTVFITSTSTSVIYTLTKPYFPSNEIYTVANKLGDVGLAEMKALECRGQ